VRDDSQQPNEPARLTTVGANELERRLLGAAAAERPSADVQRRMRAALGLSVAGAVTATAATAKAGTGVATGASGWLSAGVLAAVIVTGGVAATVLTLRAPAPAERPAIVPPAAPEPEPEQPTPVTKRVSKSGAHAARGRHPAAALEKSDLRGEIALIDSARAAIRTSPERALSLLDHYRKSYRFGVLGPEAEVLRIEALDAAGRAGEARELARSFVAKHPDYELPERVARIARR
jgi:hypothetical protein